MMSALCVLHVWELNNYTLLLSETEVELGDTPPQNRDILSSGFTSDNIWQSASFWWSHLKQGQIQNKPANGIINIKTSDI